MSEKLCPRCGGKLFYDNLDQELNCISCGWTRAVSITMPVKKIDKSKAPAKTETLRQSHSSCYPFITLHTNGAWYPPQEIKFRREHMKFLIKNLPILIEGKYPPNPIDSGYFSSPLPRISKKGGKRHSYFESPSTLAAEVEARLELCGQDGLILEAFFCWKKKPRFLCQAFNIDEHKLERRINSALAYISGWERKTRSYKEFRNHRKIITHAR